MVADGMSEHVEWAARLDDGAVLLRCDCGWQEHVRDTPDIVGAVRDHKPLIPEQDGEMPQCRPVGGTSVAG